MILIKTKSKAEFDLLSEDSNGFLVSGFSTASLSSSAIKMLGGNLSSTNVCPSNNFQGMNCNYCGTPDK